MAEERMPPPTPETPAEEQPKTKVTLTVPMSEADLGGPAAKAGDTVEVPADVAERWIEAGIAEEAPTLRERVAERVQEAIAPTEKPASGPTGRRSGSA